MDVIILAIQARILLWTTFAVLAVGLWLGHTPMTVAWRAALCAAIAMWAGGWLLRQIAQVMDERAAQDLAERQLAEQEAAKAPAKPASRSARPAPAR